MFSNDWEINFNFASYADKMNAIGLKTIDLQDTMPDALKKNTTGQILFYDDIDKYGQIRMLKKVPTLHLFGPPGSQTKVNYDFYEPKNYLAWLIENKGLYLNKKKKVNILFSRDGLNFEFSKVFFDNQFFVILSIHVIYD